MSQLEAGASSRRSTLPHRPTTAFSQPRLCTLWILFWRANKDLLFTFLVCLPSFATKSTPTSSQPHIKFVGLYNGITPPQPVLPFSESPNWSTKRQDRFSTITALSAPTFLWIPHSESIFSPFTCPDHDSDIQRCRLYQDLRAKSLTDFMQNVTLDLEDLTPYGYPDYPESLRSANSFLKCFSDPAIPRVRCTVFLWPNSNKFLSEVSFLDSLGKLTTFKTIILTHCGGMHSVRGPTSKSLDEYLSVMLGPAQHSFEVHDWRFERTHRLIYHPRRHASGMTGKETTG